jgi:hypothetical protein
MRFALTFLTIAFAGCAATAQPAPATTTTYSEPYSEPAPEPAPVSSCNDDCYQDCMDEGVLDYGASEEEAHDVCAPECGC